MQKTLLNTVQRVLDKLNLDPVNSIADTEDSYLIAREAETSFYDFITRADWPDKIDLVKATSTSDLSKPTELILDEEVHYIDSLMYDVTRTGDANKSIRKIVWLEPEDFLEKVYSRNTSNDNVVEVQYKDAPIFIYNDTMPNYYTSFDNKTIVLDSHDADVEDTLIGTKTICRGKIIPAWSESDSFVIPIQDSLFPTYLAMLASACSIYMNTQVNQEDERRQARGMSRMRREAIKTELEYYPRFKYGRNGNGLA